MNKYQAALLVVVLIHVTRLISSSPSQQKTQPHIILIIVDDWGWGDVSFHGSSQIPTPNIDQLAYSGVILNNYYVQPLCSPTRAALMTGRYPIHLGLQHDVINPAAPYGLPLNETTLAEYLQRLGYTTHLIGKWHLGFYTKEYTPTRRGFDSHFGYYTGGEDYYFRVSQNVDNYFGYDMRRNGELDYSTYGHYATDLFTTEAVKVIEQYSNSNEPLFLDISHLGVHIGTTLAPLQAPDKYTKKFPNIQSEERKIFAGMMAAVDESVGHVVQALKANKMYSNSIIIVTSDNGGLTNNRPDGAASNWPLRGSKNTLWEGGIRGNAFIHSPLLKRPKRVTSEMMHVSDWMPTLYHAAGGDVTNLPDSLDSYNLWDTLSEGTSSPRIEILHNIDPINQNAALRVGSYKIVVGNIDYNGWYRPDHLAEDFQSKWNSTAGSPVIVDCGKKPGHAMENCKPEEKPCLFDIDNDPCEYNNLANKYPDIVEGLLSRLQAYNATAVPPLNTDIDPEANPAKHNGAWVPWKKPT
ncbi:arylsulfatase J-like [Glandiceps talaboti]